MSADNNSNNNNNKRPGLDPELEHEIQEFEKDIDVDTYYHDGEEQSKMRRIFANNRAENNEKRNNEATGSGTAADDTK